MQQLIVHGGSAGSRRDYITSHSLWDGHLLTHLDGTGLSLKISDVRSLQINLAITSVKPRLVWIEEAQALTLPAQHALLKTLEEPPPNIVLVLSLPLASALLPTITSRCQLVKVSRGPLPPLDVQELSLLKTSLSHPPGKRLQLAHTLGKDRESAQAYLTSVLQTLYPVMQTTTAPKSLLLLTKLSHHTHLALNRLRDNANVTLTLESLFLSLPKIKR